MVLRFDKRLFGWVQAQNQLCMITEYAFSVFAVILYLSFQDYFPYSDIVPRHAIV